MIKLVRTTTLATLALTAAILAVAGAATAAAATAPGAAPTAAAAAAGSGPAGSAAQATDGLMSYWPLGEAAGTRAQDASGDRNGALVNGVTLAQSGAPGSSDGAAGFDGSDDYVDFGDVLDAPGRRRFAIEGWFRPSGFGAGRGSHRVIGKLGFGRRRSGYAVVIGPAPGGGHRLIFRRRSPGRSVSVASRSGIEAGRWYHFVAAYDGRRMRLFVNGALEASRRSRVRLANTRSHLRVGGAGIRGSFAGLIDELRFYRRALRASAVRDRYNAAVGAGRDDDAPPDSTPSNPPASGGGSPNPPPSTTPPATPPANPSHAVTRPVGSPILSDAEAASRISRRGWEPRPDNADENARVPTAAEINNFHQQAGSKPRHAPKVTGNFTGTTDEILQWAAHKWGIDEDLLRAIAVQESSWHMSERGDGTVYGMMQIKASAWPGTYPLTTQSTAFNVDISAAIWRSCFDFTGDQTGDQWGCTGEYFSGGWYDSGATQYIASVRNHMQNKDWEDY